VVSICIAPPCLYSSLGVLLLVVVVCFWATEARRCPRVAKAQSRAFQSGYENVNEPDEASDGPAEVPACRSVVDDAWSIFPTGSTAGAPVGAGAHCRSTARAVHRRAGAAALDSRPLGPNTGFPFLLAGAAFDSGALEVVFDPEVFPRFLSRSFLFSSSTVFNAALCAASIAERFEPNLTTAVVYPLN
jgi:hypothetical protein